MSESADQPPKKAQLAIHKGADQTLECGGLRFIACRREIGGIDGGISLNVWGEYEGESRELLRFDFFRKRPHFHSPAENADETAIDPDRFGDGTDWGIQQLTTAAPALVAAAGYESLARSLDAAELEAAASTLRETFDSLAEPSEVSYFEVDQSVLDGLAG